MAERITIARPYAEALLQRALETDNLAQWSEQLQLLATLCQQAQVVEMIADPNVDKQTINQFVLDVLGDSLMAEAKNLLQLLLENERLDFMVEIAQLFEQLKSEREQQQEVELITAQAITEEQLAHLNQQLSQHFARTIKLNTQEDPALIGGLIIRAGDVVIDASVRGRLQQMANHIGI